MTTDSNDIQIDPENKHKPHINIAPSEIQEGLKDKMRQIDLQKKESLTEETGAQLGFSYINLKGFPIGPEVISLIPEETSKKLQIICFFHLETHTRIAAVNPVHPEIKNVVRDIQKKFPGTDIQIYITSEHSFKNAFKLYSTVAQYTKTQKDLEITKENVDAIRAEVKNFKILNDKLNDASINLSQKFLIILSSALNAGSSDIHIEAEEKKVNIRFRIDGVLTVVATLPKEIWPTLISRIKGVSGLKLNINSIPQDGRITVDLSDSKLEIRVSTLPSAYGESVVMRLLNSKATSLQFEDLGIRGRAYDDLKRETERPNGMIITTGPTGSGKTTTLYAILNKLNKPEVKIITLEDPVEYKLSGITQSQIDHSKKYTFDKGLRAILRQDPDIVMVGEIRDLETAEIAIQAALTGHLVVSTIHTNDASGAIPRFMSMGVKPFLLAPAINAVIGQRLVRRICKDCKEEITLPPETLAKVKDVLSKIPEASHTKVDLENLKFYKGKGCDNCTHGYKGRIGIYEIFAMDEKIEEVVLSGKVSEYKMKELAHDAGMIEMVQDGLLKALDGLTTVDEIFRVAQ